jgi:hypothetical protein
MVGGPTTISVCPRRAFASIRLGYIQPIYPFIVSSLRNPFNVYGAVTIHGAINKVPSRVSFKSGPVGLVGSLGDGFGGLEEGLVR